ncbi:hypothetical protein [Stutzerimonas azotifigens]|uniref:Uncharacterized protein n=1 Tax=Stutzerimonas azotifigens TaxID=291995 RepID=A0ABR5Z6I2_9GAMM|nr:hypothetical protein [Stutzerimonas azotifigens]MBA1275832.1 hypothetical protein [Stutzerimonas azotifigens]
MRHALTLLVSLFALAGCGAGETAATAALQAHQAKQAQQQLAQLQQQIDEANRQSNRRLEEAARTSQ